MPRIIIATLALVSIPALARDDGQWESQQGQAFRDVTPGGI
jgi:hypothetical protein